MYAVICRELLPPRQAGATGLVVSATIFGMAFGGYASGLIFDLTSSYRMAFLNGVLWNGSISRSSAGSSGVGRGVCLRSRRSRLEFAALFLFLRRRVAFTAPGGTCGLGRPNDTARDGLGGCARRCWARTTGPVNRKPGLGVAAAHGSRSNVLIAGFASLVAGAMSMAAGEYVSVHSQKDTEDADLALERRELRTDYKGEHEELAATDVGRGLDPALAKTVADQLMAHDVSAPMPATNSASR